MKSSVVKWTGSKNSQAEEITSHFPSQIRTFYEPFCRSCAVGLRMLRTPEIRAEKCVFSDVDSNLIGLYNLLLENPNNVASYYSSLWKELSEKETVLEKTKYYNAVRKSFNENKNPLDFLFLLRTCANGLVRYNSLGEFNSPFHLTRNGIRPEKLEKLIVEWNELMETNKVSFLNCSYRDICPEKEDFVYVDPPYQNTKGIYHKEFDSEEFFDWLRELPCSYALSYDGIAGGDDFTVDVPDDLYDEHFYIESGNSSFRRLFRGKNNVKVAESLYVKLS